MSLFVVTVFVFGYILIAFEHPLKFDKTATAILTGVACWVLLVFGLDQMPVIKELSGASVNNIDFVHDALFEHLGKISEILFFLLGAMAIVEIVDVHDGFRVITDRIKTSNRTKLLWIISWVTFFLSAGLDNLTTAIIMCALLRKILHKQEEKWLFGGFIIIAANAGGAWSPIGDVTTIMLWIGGQVTALNIIKETFLASVFNLLIPILLYTYLLRKDKSILESLEEDSHHRPQTSIIERNLIFFIGMASLLSVPVFKSLTHLPPYMGILLALGIVWFTTEIIHRNKLPEERNGFSVANILHRIDTATILFFLGILLAVASLDVSGHLHQLALVLDHHFSNIYLINTMIGLLSAVVDNVPLVAAAMGMYELDNFPPDSEFWSLLAYCAGTGGSILIIGSAAGVAAMGILKIDFLWFLKRISLYAFVGYLAGIAVYYLQNHIG